MSPHTKVTALFLLLAMTDANASSQLPSATEAGFAERLYRIDCGHSVANDESVWTPGKNIGRTIEFSSTCWLIEHRNGWLLWDTGVPQAALDDPRGWSTLPKLIVYHLERSIENQLAQLGRFRGLVDRFADLSDQPHRVQIARVEAPAHARDGLDLGQLVTAARVHEKRHVGADEAGGQQRLLDGTKLAEGLDHHEPHSGTTGYTRARIFFRHLSPIR